MPRILLSLTLVIGAVVGSLYDTLTSTPFLHEGLVSANDSFLYEGRPCSYLEPENVTVAPAQGIGWTEGGSCPMLFTCVGASCRSGACTPSPAHSGFDREGGDYRAFNLPATVNGSACAAQCCEELSCVAWAYVSSAPAGQEPSCAQGTPCCYLKSAVSPETPAPGVFSGVVDRGPAPRAVPPPMGMRNSAPLGGLGAGAFEMRGDGTMHEVTIVNQSPAGAAKFGVLEDMVLGARIGGVARTLRTTPPPYAPGVAALTYSALYPLARLAVSEGSFVPAAHAVAVFAFSKLVPGDRVASAAPAVVFTLTLTNAGTQPLNASLYFSLPLASINDCARLSAVPLVANISALPDAAACLAACAAAPTCASWTHTDSAQCLLALDTPLSVHASGSSCGLRSAWSSDTSALTLTIPCTSTNSPACGDATLRPVLVVDGSTGVAGTTGSLGAAADPAALWNSFSESGAFVAGGGVSAGVFEGVAVGFGAAAVTATIPAGTNASLSLVFAWSFPHRDHDGADIGNFYTTLWADSGAVAREFAAPGQLESTVEGLAAHHGVFVGSGSSLPDWLADFLVNGMSHFRGMIWSRDGRMREFEAFDCMDLDSIHNDYQRHLPYLWLFPEFEAQKLRKWASGQAPEGYIQEFLGEFGVSPFDIPGGRIMGDTTTLWVVELYELWLSSGDGVLLAELYPTAVRALQWLMANAAPLGLPEKLYSTYDILWLDTYNTTAYNSFLYMAALRVGGELALAVGDAPTAAAAASALARAQSAVQELLWDAQGGFFRAYSYNNDSALMADSLYGVMIGSYLGLGFLGIDPLQLASHLRAEQTRNGDAFGFAAITGRVTPPPGGQKPDDTKLWQQAGPDWSSMALMLGSQGPVGGGGNVSATLDPAFRQLDNWRSRLHSLWNLAGLTSATDPNDADLSALPYCTAHYGFALTSYWLLPALSGQHTDLPRGVLSFDQAALPCPYSLPALAAGFAGRITCDAAGGYTLSVAFGDLLLPPGGLSAGGRAFAGAVNLGPGDEVSW
jgi:hypothetical protein